jgi:K+ potassium transporter
LLVARRLPGLAIIYTPSTVGVPDVLRHLLLTLPALPSVNVLLTLRFVPVPYLPEDTRFLVRRSRRMPGMYRVVQRVGYFESIDHGPAFVRQLVGCLIKHVAACSDKYGAGVRSPMPQAKHSDKAMPASTAAAASSPGSSGRRLSLSTAVSQDPEAQVWTAVEMSPSDADELLQGAPFSVCVCVRAGWLRSLLLRPCSPVE